jgi:hypothetical protein
MRRPRSEKGLELVEEAAEARSRGKGLEATYQPIARLDPPMILFQMVVEGAIRPVRHPIPKDVPNGTWVGVMPIGGEALRHHPGHRPGRVKKASVTARSRVSLSRASIRRPSRSIARYKSHQRPCTFT